MATYRQHLYSLDFTLCKGSGLMHNCTDTSIRARGHLHHLCTGCKSVDWNLRHRYKAFLTETNDQDPNKLTRIFVRDEDINQGRQTGKCWVYSVTCPALFMSPWSGRLRNRRSIPDRGKRFVASLQRPSNLLYRVADKSLARPTSWCTLFDGQNISFDVSLVIRVYIYTRVLQKVSALFFF